MRISAHGPMASRIILLTENLAIVPKEDRPAQLSRLSLPPDNLNPTENEIIAYLKTLIPNELKDLGTSLLEKIPLLVARLGRGYVEPSLLDEATNGQSEKTRAAVD